MERLYLLFAMQYKGLHDTLKIIFKALQDKIHTYSYIYLRIKLTILLIKGVLQVNAKTILPNTE